jgi:alpha-glucosidase
MGRSFLKSILLIAALVGGISANSFCQSFPLTLSSPNQELSLQFATAPVKGSTSGGGKLVYSVSYRGKPVLDQSALGLELEGQSLLGADVQVVNSIAGQGVDDYSLLAGKASKVQDEYKSLTVQLKEDGNAGRTFSMEARAYNDGVAFRYVLPAQDTIKEIRLKQEDTEFRISTDATTWALELPNYRSSYESEYVKLPISAFSNQGGVSSTFLIGLPC